MYQMKLCKPFRLWSKIDNLFRHYFHIERTCKYYQALICFFNISLIPSVRASIFFRASSFLALISSKKATALLLLFAEITTFFSVDIIIVFLVIVGYRSSRVIWTNV